MKTLSVRADATAEPSGTMRERSRGRAGLNKPASGKVSVTILVRAAWKNIYMPRSSELSSITLIGRRYLRLFMEEAQ